MNGSCPFAVRRRSPRGMPGSWSRIREGRGNRSISPNLEYAGKARSYPLHGDALCGRNEQRDPHKRDPPVPHREILTRYVPVTERRSDPVVGEILYRRYRGVAFYSFRPRSPVPGKQAQCDRSYHDKAVRYGFPVQGKDHHADDRHHDKYSQSTKNTGKNPGHRDAGNN